jgi:hypothetical protein
MSTDFQVVLLSAVPAVVGLLVLRFATRRRSDESSDIGFFRGLAFVGAGLLLIGLPLLVWGLSFHERAAQHDHPVTPGGIFLFAGYLNAAFFWLIWSVNAYAFRVPGIDDSPWDTNWGASYSPELKRRILGSLFEQMDKQGKIGDLVVDIGSGATPVSKVMPPAKGRKFILIDIAAKNRTSSESAYIRLDAEKIVRPDSLSYKKALVGICRFLSTDARSPVREERATTMVFSDILNYVDYRQVLSGFAGFLQANGRIIIVNLPSRGIRDEFSAKGLKANDELIPFLAEQNLAIEYKDFPCRPKDGTDESEELIVLVARKEKGKEEIEKER